MTGLGIIAGGGELPVAVAQSASESGRSIFILSLNDLADDRLAKFPHEKASPGEAGRILSLFRQHGCSDIVLVGKVARPKWNELKFDATAVRKLPKVMSAALKGDDALLRSFVDILEGEGFRVVGVAEAAPGLLAPVGAVGKHRPSPRDEADIKRGIEVVRTLGACDVGQAVVVCEGLVLAVEAAEGTDAMIARIAGLSETIRGTAEKPRGVLIKARKSTQDGRTDLPVVGPDTVKNVLAVGLAGIAVEAGSSLVVNRQAVVERADGAGLFLFGFSPTA
ncbi:MAG: UDP-2,3-diacylglucosamine diphosphatase LpxI [Alphaproteobacteria bacterium]|nr:UDP-2,3-diacylglucosamine diphosphatase LpxI [Alphaproteobacteria bacterium]